MKPSLVFVALSIGAASPSWGSAGITYHGRLIAPDGSSVEASSVRFRLQIRSPGNENCLLYQETHTRNLNGTQGIFSITINDGTASSVNTEPFSLDRVFQNRGTFSFAAGKCAIGSTYTPNPADGRRLAVEFDDGTFGGDWEQLPSQAINFVPMALESLSVGGYGQGSLLRVHDGSGFPASVPALTSSQYGAFLDLLSGSSSSYLTSASALNGANLAAGSVDDAKLAGGISGSKIGGDISGKAAGFSGALGGDVTGGQSSTVVEGLQGRAIDAGAPADGQVLKWSALHDRWEPANDAEGSTGVASVAVNAPIVNSGTPTALALSVSDATTSAKGIVRLATSSDTSAGLAVQADDARLTDARAPTSHSHAVSEITSGAAKYFTYEPNGAPCIANQILKWISNRWECADDDDLPTNFGIGDLKTSLGAAQFTQASCSASQTLTWSALTDAFSCANISGLSASAISAGTIASARLGSGTADGTTFLRGDGTWQPMTSSLWMEAGGNVYRNGGNVGIGTSSPSAKLHIAGTAGVDGIMFPDGTMQTSAAVSSGANNSLIPSWPDMILCSGSDGKIPFELYLYYPVGNYVMYRPAGSIGDYSYMSYNISTGAQVAHVTTGGFANFMTDCSGKTIAQLVAAGQTVNVAKGPAAQWLQNGTSGYYNAGNVGVGTTSPAAKLDVAGEIKLGNTSSTCDSSREGQQRYNSAAKKMEFCDGTAWTVLGSGGEGESEGAPVGSIVAMSTTTCPTGYLAANGVAISRSTYANLFAAISTMYGAGDGSTTFNLPDYRGYFLRGWANGSTIDPDRASRTNRGDGTMGDNVGTKQSYQLHAHSHSGVVKIDTSNYGAPSPNGDLMGRIVSGTSSASGGNETRPSNINVLYCIKQ